MATRKVFISYDYENDRRYRNLLLAWSKETGFADFYFNDQPVSVPVTSSNAMQVKRVISAKIDATAAFLCIVGSEAQGNDWVDWEIRQAVELRKKMLAVKTAESNPTPSALFGTGVVWAQSFTLDDIKLALDQAYAQ